MQPKSKGRISLALMLFTAAIAPAWSAGVVQTSMSFTDVKFQAIDLTPNDGLAASYSWGQPALVGMASLNNVAPTYSYPVPTELRFMSNGRVQSDITHTTPAYLGQAWARTSGDMGSSSGLTADAANAFLAKGTTGISRTLAPVTGEVTLVDTCYGYLRPECYQTPGGLSNLVIAPHTALEVTANLTFDVDHDESLLNRDLWQYWKPSYNFDGTAYMSLTAQDGSQSASDYGLRLKGGAEFDMAGNQKYSYLTRNEATFNADPFSPYGEQVKLRLVNDSDSPLAARFSASVSTNTRMYLGLPEPGTWATFGLGLAGVAFAARRRRVSQA